MYSVHHPSSCARCGSRKKLDPNAAQRDGKAVSARNATSHGLFARDVVLPHLGEDADAYNALLGEFLAQIAPKNLLERHYVEKIAAGTWRLRRLHRWQAQLFEDPSLDEGERLDKLDKVLRHETALHRQIDAAVRMLGKDVAHLFATRARAQAMTDWEATPQDCKDTPAVAKQIEYQIRRNLDFPPFPADGFDLTTLDTLRPTPPTETQKEDCQNETRPDDAPVSAAADTVGAHCDAPATDDNTPDPADAPPPIHSPDDTKICQNEPPHAHHPSVLPHREDPQRSGEVGSPPLLGAGGPPPPRTRDENDFY